MLLVLVVPKKNYNNRSTNSSSTMAMPTTKKKSRERVRRNTYTHPDTNVGRSLEDEAWNSNFDYSNFDYDRSDGESTKITYGDKTIQVSDDPSYWQLWVWAVVVSVGLTLLCCLRKCCCR
mmetsp:Transcript_20947/g.44458  ORF Transcript_20947/g.44458 Transcript_20947/m.44458 type:complete len:120 (-) Transcript_20947:570-929(-)